MAKSRLLSTHAKKIPVLKKEESNGSVQRLNKTKAKQILMGLLVEKGGKMAGKMLERHMKNSSKLTTEDFNLILDEVISSGKVVCEDGFVSLDLKI